MKTWIFTLLILSVHFVPSYLLADDLPRATQRFEEMLVQAPTTGRALDEVFSYFTTQRSVIALEERWQHAMQEKPEQAYSYALLLGLLYRRIGDIPAAAEQFMHASILKPEDYRSYFYLGQTRAIEGKTQEAIEALQVAITHPIPPLDQRDVYEVLARAQARKQDHQGAVVTWKKLMELFPDDPMIMDEVGQVFLDMNQIDEARNVFTQLLEASKADPLRSLLAEFRLAELLEREQKTAEAIQRYASILSRTHSANWLHKEISGKIQHSFRRRNDLDGLIAFYEQQRETHPQDLSLALQLAHLYAETRKPESSLQLMRQLVQQHPDNSDLQYQYARQLIDQQQWALTQPVLESLVEQFPQRWEYRELLGELHWAQAKAESSQDFSRAIEVWSQLIPEENPDTTSLVRLAELFRRYYLEQPSIELYVRAIEQSPADYDLRERIAQYLFALYKDEWAWKILRNDGKGLSKADHYLRLAKIEAQRNQPTEALQSIEAGLALEPGHFYLLNQQWHIFNTLKDWNRAISLYDALQQSSPNELTTEQIEQRHAQLLHTTHRDAIAFAQLTQKIDENPDSLTEAEYRLLLRIATHRNDARTRNWLQMAVQRHPQSYLIQRIESAYYGTQRLYQEQIQSLRRGIALRPDKAKEMLTSIAYIYRTLNSIDPMREVLREMASLYPEDSQTYVLLAELEFHLGNFNPGIEALYRAISLSSDPTHLKAQLAQRLMQANRFDEALAVYEEAFGNATTTEERLPLIPFIAQAILTTPQYETYPEQFLSRRSSLHNTPEYHLYRGELFSHTNQHSQAKKEWEMGLALNQDHPLILQRMLSLALQEQNDSLILQTARSLYRNTPNEDNLLLLIDALARNRELDEVINLLQSTQTDLLLHPQSLYTTLNSAKSSGELPRILPLVQTVESPDSGSPRWMKILTLADTLIRIDETEEVTRLLWEISYDKTDQTLINRLQSTVISDSVLNHHTHAMYHVASDFQQLQYSRRQAASMRSHFQLRIVSVAPSYSSNRAQSNLSLADAQLRSLLYLSFIAKNQQKETEFIRQLQEWLQNNNPTPEIQLLIHHTVGYRDGALNDLLAILKNEKWHPEVHQLLFNIVIPQNLLYQEFLDTTLSDTVLQILHLYADQGPSQRKTVLPALIAQQSYQGRTEDAIRQLQEAINDINSYNHGVRRVLLALQLQLAIASQDSSLLESFLSNLPGNSDGSTLLSLYFRALPNPEISPQLISALRKVLTADDGRHSYGSLGAIVQISDWVNTRFLSPDNIQLLQFITPELKEEKLQNIIQQFESFVEKKDPDAHSLLTALAHIELAKGNSERAIEHLQQIVQESADIYTQYNLAYILRGTKKYDAAIELLEKMSPKNQFFQATIQIQLIQLYILTQQRAKAIQTAQALLDSKVDLSANPQNIRKYLMDLGLEKSPPVRVVRTVPTPSRSPVAVTRQQQLSQEFNQANTTDRVEIAMRVLRELPIEPDNNSIRTRAIRVLKEANGLDPYLNAIRAEYIKNPDSSQEWSTLMQIYQAANMQQEQIELYQQMLGKNSDDVNFWMPYIDLLLRTKQNHRLIPFLEQHPQFPVSHALRSVQPTSYTHQQSSTVLDTIVSESKTDFLLLRLQQDIRNNRYSNLSINIAIAVADYLHAHGNRTAALQIWDDLLSPEVRIKLLHVIMSRANSHHAYLGGLQSFLDIYQESGTKDKDRLYLLIDMISLPQQQQSPGAIHHPIHSHQESFTPFQISYSNQKILVPFNSLLQSIHRESSLKLLLDTVQERLQQSRQHNLVILELALRTRLFDLTVIEELDTIPLTEFSRRSISNPHALSRSVLSSRKTFLTLVDSVFHWPQHQDMFLRWFPPSSYGYSGGQRNNSHYLEMAAIHEALFHSINTRKKDQVHAYIRSLEMLLSADPNIAYNIHYTTLYLLALTEQYDLLAHYVALYKQHRGTSTLIKHYDQLLHLLPASEELQLQLQICPLDYDPDAGLEVAWEFSLSDRNRSQSYGLPLPKPKEKHDLTITVHNDMNGPAIHSYSFYSVPPQGKVSIPVSLDHGFIKASVTSDNAHGKVTDSSAVLFSTTPNLLAPLIAVVDQQQQRLRLPGWQLPSIMPHTAHVGGPFYQISYARFSSPLSSHRVLLSSEPIPYSPQQTMLLSAWLLNARIYLNLLDQQGKILSTNILSYSDSQSWRHQSIVVRPIQFSMRTSINTARQNAPAEAAFIQIHIIGVSPSGIAAPSLQILDLP